MCMDNVLSDLNTLRGGDRPLITLNQGAFVVGDLGLSAILIPEWVV